jgi:hypothetical protein
MIGEVVGIVPFIRSLRTTGCRSSVFFFTDASAQRAMTSDEISLLQNCSVFVISTGDYSSRPWKEIAFLRYPMFYDFLYSRLNLIDRVIAVDLYDTVFQADPFTEDFETDKFYFVQENSTIQSCFLNSLWLKLFSADQYERLKERHVVSSGIFMGGIVPMLQFLDAYHRNDTAPRKVPDQGYFVYMAYEFMRRARNTNIKVLTENDGVIILHYFSDGRSRFVFGNFNPAQATRYPAIIHQYDKWFALSNSVLNACPKGRLRTSTYIRQLPDSVDDSEGSKMTSQ